MTTKFKEYLTTAETLHMTDSKLVAENLKKNLNLIETTEDLNEMAEFTVHVCGEHLGDWKTGLEVLKRLKNNIHHKDKALMNRLIAILELGDNAKASLEMFSTEDKVLIYTATAKALKRLGGIKRSELYLEEIKKLQA